MARADLGRSHIYLHSLDEHHSDPAAAALIGLIGLGEPGFSSQVTPCSGFRDRSLTVGAFLALGAGLQSSAIRLVGPSTADETHSQYPRVLNLLAPG